MTLNELIEKAIEGFKAGAYKKSKARLPVEIFELGIGTGFAIATELLQKQHPQAAISLDEQAKNLP